MRSHVVLFRSLLADAWRQDFSASLRRLRTTYGLRLPAWVLWTVSIAAQNSLVVWAAMLMETLTGTVLLPLLLAVVFMFNALLPLTMARQAAARLRDHPLAQLWWQSPHPPKTLFALWAAAETAMFWLRDMMFELVAVYALLRFGPGVLGAVLLVMLWIAGVSLAFFMVLYRSFATMWTRVAAPDARDEAFYLARLAVVAIAVWFVVESYLAPFRDAPLAGNLSGSALKSGIVSAVERMRAIALEQWQEAKSTIKQYTGSAVTATVAALFAVVWGMIRSFRADVRWAPRASTLPLHRKNGAFFTVIRRLAGICFPNDPWIWRDVVTIARIRHHTRLPYVLNWAIPPATASVVPFAVMLYRLPSAEMFIVCFWFVAAFAIFQTLWIWYAACPVLHLSGELRMIDATRLSPRTTVGKLLRAKNRLLLLLQAPFFLLLNGLYTSGALYVGGRPAVWLVGWAGLWALWLAVTRAFIGRTAFGARFDAPNLLAVHTDTMEARWMRQLYDFPLRLALVGLFLAFFYSFFFGRPMRDVFPDATAGVLAFFVVSLYAFRRLERKLERTEGG